jgi:hypothetical protein
VEQPQAEPLPSPEQQNELARHLLQLAASEPDPQRRRELNELAALNAALGMVGRLQPNQQQEPPVS